MKVETQYKDVSVAIEFTPEEIGKFVPFFVRALFNKKLAIIKTYHLLEQTLNECQVKNGWKNFVSKKPYLKEERICLLVQQMPFFIKNGVMERFISEYTIDNYERSNIFFAVMDLFFYKLKMKDMLKIFERFNDNDQASLSSFLEFVEKNRPQLLTARIVEYIRLEKIKWETENNNVAEI